MAGGLFNRNKTKQPVKDTVKKPTDLLQAQTAGHLYAIMRRLGERITDLERREGENRRDISRIGKRQYRTGDNEPLPLQQAEKKVETFAGMYGIEEN